MFRWHLGSRYTLQYFRHTMVTWPNNFDPSPLWAARVVYLITCRCWLGWSWHKTLTVYSSDRLVHLLFLSQSTIFQSYRCSGGLKKFDLQFSRSSNSSWFKYNHYPNKQHEQLSEDHRECLFNLKQQLISVNHIKITLPNRRKSQK